MSDPSSTLPRCFQPSTMASRRAEREARGEAGSRPRQLVSLGWRTEHLAPVGTVGPHAEWREHRFELLFDRDDPNDRFIRFTPEGPIEPLVARQGGGTHVVASETVRVRPRRVTGEQTTKVVWSSAGDDED